MEDNKKKNPATEDEHMSGDEAAANAANLDSIIGGATSAARSNRHTDTLSNTGTNISYEGNTAPAGGGSVGTGQASGQDAVGARITTSDKHDHSTGSSRGEAKEGEEHMKSEEHDDDLDRDTLGTP